MIIMKYFFLVMERQEVEFASSACVAYTPDLLFPLTQKHNEKPPQVEPDT